MLSTSVTVTRQQGVKRVFNNIVLTCRGQNPNGAAGEIRFAICCSLKWNTVFHTVSKELCVPVADSWLRRDFGPCAQHVNHQLSQAQRPAVSHGCNRINADTSSVHKVRQNAVQCTAEIRDSVCVLYLLALTPAEPRVILVQRGARTEWQERLQVLAVDQTCMSWAGDVYTALRCSHPFPH